MPSTPLPPLILICVTAALMCHGPLNQLALALERGADRAMLGWLLKFFKVATHLALIPFHFVCAAINRLTSVSHRTGQNLMDVAPIAAVMRILQQVASAVESAIIWALNYLFSAVVAVVLVPVALLARILLCFGPPAESLAAWLTRTLGGWGVARLLAGVLQRWGTSSRKTNRTMLDALCQMLDTLGLMRVLLWLVQTRAARAVMIVAQAVGGVLEGIVGTVARLWSFGDRAGKEDRKTHRYMPEVPALAMARDTALQVNIHDIGRGGIRIRFPKKLNSGETVSLRISGVHARSRKAQAAAQAAAAPARINQYGVAVDENGVPLPAAPIAVADDPDVTTIHTHVRWCKARQGSSDYFVGLAFGGNQPPATVTWLQEELQFLEDRRNSIVK